MRISQHLATASSSTPSVLRRITLATAIACVLLPAGSASAGRLLATGHDADHHCGRGERASSGALEYRQCGTFRVAVDYVRAGAPDPGKPVLVLDRGALDVVAALDRVYGAGAVPRTVVSPRSQEFASAPITTDRYSAVIIASSGGDAGDQTQQDLNEVGSAPDSEAINRRAADLRAFFDAGGGIFAGSGNWHGDDPEDPYYGFLPITVQGAKTSYPFRLTDLGRALGFPVNEVNCCATHNTFDMPAESSALKPVDVDAAGRVVTLVAETARFSGLGDAPITPAVRQEIAQQLPSTKRCVRRKTITMRLKRPRGVRFSRATVYLNNKRVKRLRGRSVTRSYKLRVPKTGTRARVKVVVVTTGKRKLTIRRTYKICS